MCICKSVPTIVEVWFVQCVVYEGDTQWYIKARRVPNNKTWTSVINL